MNREFKIHPTGIIAHHPDGCDCEFSVREFEVKGETMFRVFWRVSHRQDWSLVNEVVKRPLDGQARWVQNDGQLITSREIDEYGKAIDYCLEMYAKNTRAKL